MKKYKPAELALLPAPMPYLLEHAECPTCRVEDASVIGRLGRRLVFRCERCDIRFHRATPETGPT